MKEPRSHSSIGKSSKAKGAKAELEVARLLDPWWSRLEPGARFIRSPGSGGWRHAKRFGARGDLMPDPDLVKQFPFVLEVKRREGWSEEGFLLGSRGGKSPVWSWWQQCQKAAEDAALRPMLWFRKSHASNKVLGLPNCWLVMIDEAVYDRLHLRGKTPPLVRFDAPRHTVVLTHAQTLWIPPSAFVDACRAANEQDLLIASQRFKEANWG